MTVSLKFRLFSGNNNKIMTAQTVMISVDRASFAFYFVDELRNLLIINDISWSFDFVFRHRFPHDSLQGFRHCSDIWRRMTWYIRCMFCRWRTTAECSVPSTSRCHHRRAMYTSWICELCSLAASCLARRPYREVRRWHSYFIGRPSTAVFHCCSP